MPEVVRTPEGYKTIETGGRIVVVVPDATPVVVPLGVISDGQTLNVSLSGGGSIPGPPASNIYVVDPCSATFRREGGLGFVSQIVDVQDSGAPIDLIFQHDDGPTETVCQLLITALGFPYVSHFRVAPILKF